jgi:hypothetical protein
MTYRIEITADSLTELAGRVAALAVQLQASAAPLAYAAPVVVKDPTPARTAAKKIAAQMAAAEPVAEPAAEPVAEYVAPEVRENPVAPAAPAAVVYDPVVDIAPRVLAYVALRGRDAMLELLSQFGVERASHVPPEHHAELVALLDAAINA